MGQVLTPIIFIICYTLFAVLPSRRHWIAIAGAAVVLVLGLWGHGITFTEAFISHEPTMAGDPGGPAVNWTVMGIFLGTLVVAELFMTSGMPAHLADVIIRRSPSVRVALLAICAMTSLISAFVENVAAVLIIAPVALAMTERLKIRPVPFFVALAISSNLQGCATLIGDPPSMLLGAAGKMSFNDFLWMRGRPSIFFAVQLGAAASFLVLLAAFWKHKRAVEFEKLEPVKSIVPTWLMVGLIVALAIGGSLGEEFNYLPGIICMAFGAIALIWDTIAHRTDAWAFIRKLDWATTFFLLSVFVLVGSLSAQGVLKHLADGIAHLAGGNLLATFVILIVVAMIVSAFVDNVPFLIAMIPVTMQLNAELGFVDHTAAGTVFTDPRAYLLLFGLLLGASLGGNISPIGASANIVAMGLMQKRGYNPRFGEFVRLGLPFTLLAIGTGALFVWFVWR